MQQGLLSICCLGYNHAEFLAENLNTIAKIDYPNIEVVVVDDGSSDNSVELLSTIAKEYPLPIKIIAQQNTGNIGKNFNTALSYCQGEFVSFISLDDVLNATVVLTEINAMNKNPKLAFIASTVAKSIDNNGYLNNAISPLPTTEKTELSIQQLLDYEYSDFGAFYIQGSLFRNEIIQKIGAFDEDMTGDDIVLRTKLFRFIIEQNKQEQKWQHQLLNTNNVFYRIHDNNVHKNTLRQLKIVTEYLERYWSDKESPQMLIEWAKHYIRTQPNQIDKLFELNNRSKSLKNHPEIKAIINETLEIGLPFSKKIYRKIKFESGARQIVLLNTFRLNYQKKSKINKQATVKKVHYTETLNI